MPDDDEFKTPVASSFVEAVVWIQPQSDRLSKKKREDLNKRQENLKKE